MMAWPLAREYGLYDTSLFLAPVEAKNLSSTCDVRLVRYQPPKLIFLNDILLGDNYHTFIISKYRSVILLFMRLFL